MYPEDGATKHRLLSAADAAMYGEKNDKKGAPAEQQNEDTEAAARE
jgi:hypothetical protein